MTASSTARVRCDRPGRYARSLANRFAQTAHTEWDSEQETGHMLFTWGLEGEVDMIAGDGVLLLHLVGPVGEIEQFEAMIGGSLVDIARGTGLEVVWKRTGGREGTRWVADGPDVAEGGQKEETPGAVD